MGPGSLPLCGRHSRWAISLRVLVAEDDEPLRSILERGLRENGYVVDAVPDGYSAIRHLRAYQYEVVVLDWRMPKLSGLEVLEHARRRGVRTPILMLTARDAISDRVAGLQAGSDDYLVKPFEFAELLARLQALQRRPALSVDTQLGCGDLRLDPLTRIVTIRGEPVPFTAIEIGVLELLMRRAPGVVTRRTIAVQVWEDEADAVGSNTIDVHIARLRAKLEASHARVTTVRGTGYRLETV